MIMMPTADARHRCRSGARHSFRHPTGLLVASLAGTFRAGVVWGLT